jgi:von Willebrand factor type A domain/CARDB
MSMSARAGVAPQGSDAYTQALKQLAGSDGAVSRFDRARAAALAVLAALPQGSTVQVVAASDRAELLGPRTPSHLDAAKALIEQMTLTECGTDLEPAVTRAAALLEAGPSPGKELYVFSDMQKNGFEANPTKLTGALRAMRERTAITFVRCGTDAITNVSLTGITPQTTLRSGDRADFAVLVRNTGQQTARNLTVVLEIDGKESERDSQPVAEIKPGETRAVVLSGVLDKPGRHVLTATVKADDLPGDNRYDQVIRVNDQVGVLLVDGAPDPRDARRSASFFLQHALNPGSSAGLPVTTITPDRASPRDLGGKEVCILVNVRLEAVGKEEGGALSPEFLRALATFVQEGRGLVVFPGDRVEPEPYNRLLFEQLRLLPYRITKIDTTAEDKPWLLARGSAAGPFARFREEQGYATLDRIETRRRLLIEPPKEDEAKALAEESRIYLKSRDGAPAVVGRKRPGQGEVILFTTSVHDGNWSDWFIAPAFLPVVQVTLNHLLEGRPETLNRVAGERLEWQVAKADEETNFDLVRSDGSRQRLGFPASAGGRALLTSTDLTRAGLYRIVPAGRDADENSPLFAVAPDVRETDELQSLTWAEIDEKVGFPARHLTAGDDGGAFTGAERMRSEWTNWLLLALLVFVVGEMALAWWCGRSW